MAIEVTVPEMGESILEATVSHWLKKEGEYVNVGDVLVELETDKVNVEVGAKGAGVLQQIKVQEGGDVKVGDVLAGTRSGNETTRKSRGCAKTSRTCAGTKTGLNPASTSEWKTREAEGSPDCHPGGFPPGTG
jgi:2-oxoglutarate dehydrogenase E2 component (dihydrolipoamide succinyltransferase)